MSSSESQNKGESRAAWTRARRLEFIEYRALWEGHVNRQDLRDAFQISMAQASIDVRDYEGLAPGNLEYDRQRKRYVPSAVFAPRLVTDDPESYLGDVFARLTGVAGEEASRLGWMPPCDWVAPARRRVQAGVLRVVLRAIREARTARITYQSMDKPEPLERDISPHALANDGLRWHARAYCHREGKFKDFVLGRMTAAELRAEATGGGSGADKEWSHYVEVVLAPSPRLLPGPRRAIELDYGMEDGRAVVQTRLALLRYVLLSLRLWRPPADARPEEEQVVLVNRDQLLPYLPAQQGGRG